MSVHRPWFISSSEGPVGAVAPSGPVGVAASLCNAAPPLTSACLLQWQHNHKLSCSLNLSVLWVLMVRLLWGCFCELKLQGETTPISPDTGLTAGWRWCSSSSRTDPIFVSPCETWAHITHYLLSKCGGRLWEVSSGQDEECGTVCGIQSGFQVFWTIITTCESAQDQKTKKERKNKPISTAGNIKTGFNTEASDAPHIQP